VEPFFLDRDLALSLTLFYSENDTDDSRSFSTSSVGFRPGLEFPVGEFSRLGVFYSIEQNELSIDDPSDLSRVLLSDIGEETTSSIGYTYAYSTIGRGLDPTRGVLLRFGQEFAGLGGDAEFVKTIFLARGQRAVRNEEVILSAALEGGALVSLGDDDSSQANRFFNRQTIIRGFESAGIGPRDLVADEDALGGNYYVAARFESRFPLGFLPDEYGISGAAFLDMGSVWGLDTVEGGTATNPTIVDDDFYLNSAVGFGILWDTQIGPLRFNFTEALNARDYDREQSFDLTIATRF
jgi:outer membrane protein insertion porin family